MTPQALATVLALAACEKPATELVPAEVRCVRGEDCALLPSALTCCIECPPAPPFEAAASWVLDGMLTENDTVCVDPHHVCPQIACNPVPDGCVARAACVAGRCVALAEGCELPTT